MKIKDGFVIREIAGNLVAVPTGNLVREVKSIINLNEPGKFIWELLQKEDLDVEEIAERLVVRYKIDKQRAKVDTEKFVQKLKDTNVIK